MKRLFLAIIFLINSKAYSFDLGLDEHYSPFKVDEMYIEYRKYQTLRDPYYPPEKDNEWDWTSEFHWKVSTFKRLYWDNNFQIRMDQSQIRHGGWEYYLGVKTFDWLDIIKYHHSQHCFECENDKRRFPVEDSYGVRVYFKLPSK